MNKNTTFTTCFPSVPVVVITSGWYVISYGFVLCGSTFSHSGPFQWSPSMIGRMFQCMFVRFGTIRLRVSFCRTAVAKCRTSLTGGTATHIPVKVRLVVCFRPSMAHFSRCNGRRDLRIKNIYLAKQQLYRQLPQQYIW